MPKPYSAQLVKNFKIKSWPPELEVSQMPAWCLVVIMAVVFMLFVAYMLLK